mgnify:CR=1 FL=1
MCYDVYGSEVLLVYGWALFRSGLDAFSVVFGGRKWRLNESSEFRCFH